MPLLAFRSAWDRIYRAEGHRDEFWRLWKEFCEDDPYTTSLHIEDDGAGTIHVFHQYDTLPNVFSFELGEMLYHLRAALDSAVYGCAVSKSGQDPPPNYDALEFPVRTDPDKFKSARWHIAPLSDECQRIIESVQPYKIVPDLRSDYLVLSPHRAFGILNDWARIDRHRRLHVVGSWATHRNPQLLLPDGCELENLFVTYDGFLEDDDLLATFKLRGFVRGMDVKANPDLAIDVAVNETPEPCADNDTLDMRLRTMFAYVKEIVRVLEETCERERKVTSSGDDPVGGGGH